MVQVLYLLSCNTKFKIPSSLNTQGSKNTKNITYPLLLFVVRDFSPVFLRQVFHLNLMLKLYVKVVDNKSSATLSGFYFWNFKVCDDVISYLAKYGYKMDNCKKFFRKR